MKAAIRKGFLGFSMSFSENFTVPKFDAVKNKNEVKVKVNSAAINPVDYKLPRAALGSVVGMDFCGTVVEVGAEANSKFDVGDIIYGTATGSAAEFTIADAAKVAKAKSDWSLAEYAALGVAYQSALQCLQKGGIVDKEGSKQEGKSVLVIGASGGCGIAGLQLCKAVGVTSVVAICSKKNEELVCKNGATRVIDYQNESELASFFDNNKGKFDCVYDAATNSGGGEDYWEKSVVLLKEDVGQFTALNGPGAKWMRAFLGKEKEHESIIMMNPNTADLEQIVELLDRTGDRPPTNVMSFDEEGLEKAFTLLKSRRSKGKIVFNISS